MATQIELQEKLNLAHGRMMEQLPKNADTGEVDYENGTWDDEDAQAKYKAAAAEVQSLNTQLEIYNTINRTKNQQDLAAANIAAKAGTSVDEARNEVGKFYDSVEAFIKFGTQGNKHGKMSDEQISYMGNLNLAGTPGGRESFALDTTAPDKGANMVPDEVSADILLELREVNPDPRTGNGSPSDDRQEEDADLHRRHRHQGRGESREHCGSRSRSANRWKGDQFFLHR